MRLHTILTYDEALIKQAVLAYWRRSFGAFFVPVLLALTAWLIALLVQRDFSWQTGALGAVIGFCFLISASVYVVHYKNSLVKFRALADSHATFQANDDSFTMASSIGTSTLKWNAVKEVWQFPNVWLLLFSQAQFCTLPVANLSPELQDAILARVQGAGGKIDSAEIPSKLNLAAISIAAACVPLTKATFMFAQYRLHFAPDASYELAALVVATIAACVLACRGAVSPQSILLRAAAAILWSGVAYVVIAFMPGCLWTPACL